MGNTEPRGEWTRRTDDDSPRWRRYEERPLSGAYAGWFEGRVRTLWWHPAYWGHLTRRLTRWGRR